MRTTRTENVETLCATRKGGDEVILFLDEVLNSLKEGALVLDAGCGAGSFPHSRFPGLRIVSVDVKKPPAARSVPVAGNDLAARPCASPGTSPRNFTLGNVERLPVAGRTVDLMILNYVLEHVTDAEATVAEAARVLVPQAMLYAALPNSRSFDDRFYRFAGYFAKYGLLKLHKRLEHQQRFEFLSLNEVFYRNGFRLLSFCECPSGYTWMNDPRVKRFHEIFLKILTFLKSALRIDLFESSNYLVLYQYVGQKGVRCVTHVCSVCGMQLLREQASRAGRWKCPHCGSVNVHG